MTANLSTDEDVNHFFDDVIASMQRIFGYSMIEASNLVQNYYSFFRDPQYCAAISIPLQDDDFFFHEGATGMAYRIHYYLGIKADPNPHSFIKWRSSFFNTSRHKTDTK